MGGRPLSETHFTFHLVALHKMIWMKAPKRKVQAPGCCEFLSAASAQLIVSRDAAVRAAADRAFSPANTEHPPPRRHFRLPCSDTDTLITADRNIFTRLQ